MPDTKSDRPSLCHAIVSMFGKTKKCKVTAYGAPQDKYTKDQMFWVERPEDEYGISHYSPPFCVLYREDWLRAEELE